jgi:hypothetical protein
MMEKKLKELDKVMDQAIYQRKRFSSHKKDEILKEVQRRKKRSGQYSHPFHQLLSYATLLLLFVFSFSTIYFSDGNSNEIKKDVTIESKHEPVASLVLLHRVEEVLFRDKMILDADIFKNESHIELSIIVPTHYSVDEMKKVASMFLNKGRDIYLRLPSSKEKKIDVFGPYTISVSVRRSSVSDRRFMDFTTDYSNALSGMKYKNDSDISW